MNAELTQDELESLSAYYDGELPPEQVQAVERRLAGDAAWQRAYSQIQSLDEAMEAWRVPLPPEGLRARIVQAAHRQALRFERSRWSRWLAPASAAAAAIVLAVVLVKALHRPPAAVAPQQGAATPVAQVADRQAVDEFVVENLDFMHDMEVLANLDTLEAIEQIEVWGTGS